MTATKWVDRLAQTRDDLCINASEEGMPQPADEDVLRQFVYSAIYAFIEHDSFRLIADLLDDDFDIDAAVDKWVDA